MFALAYCFCFLFSFSIFTVHFLLFTLLLFTIYDTSYFLLFILYFDFLIEGIFELTPLENLKSLSSFFGPIKGSSGLEVSALSLFRRFEQLHTQIGIKVAVAVNFWQRWSLEDRSFNLSRAPSFFDPGMILDIFQSHSLF